MPNYLEEFESEQEIELELWAIDGYQNPNVFPDSEVTDTSDYKVIVRRENGLGGNAITLTISGIEYCLDGMELVAAIANSLV